MTESDRRDQFLIAMYNQLMNDINRHIVVVWQSIATLVAAIAAFSLVKETVITFDVATSIVLLVCIWLLIHVYDASYWYNRNLVMIANIERQFLEKNDLRNIHYYFGSHRPKNKMISHLKAQRLFGVSIACLILAFHLFEVMLPAIRITAAFEFFNLAPWVIALFGAYKWYSVAQENKSKYEEFLKNSPGISVDTTGIEFGIGHGHEDEPNSL